MAYPRNALHPKVVGDQSQAMVLGRLVQAYPDAQVWIPFGENTRADLVIEKNDRFIRVQCKTGRLRKGVVRFSTCSHTYHHPSNRGTRPYQHHYRGQADLFGVYCPETDGVYLVPVDDVGMTYGSLRIEPAQNNQTKKIRWACDYQLRAGLAQLAEQRFCKPQAVGSNPTPGSNHPRLPI
jgi:hypothetical protein